MESHPTLDLTFLERHLACTASYSRRDHVRGVSSRRCSLPPERPCERRALLGVAPFTSFSHRTTRRGTRWSRRRTYIWTPSFVPPTCRRFAPPSRAHTALQQSTIRVGLARYDSTKAHLREWTPSKPCQLLPPSIDFVNPKHSTLRRCLYNSFRFLSPNGPLSLSSACPSIATVSAGRTTR